LLIMKETACSSRVERPYIVSTKLTENLAKIVFVFTPNSVMSYKTVPTLFRYIRRFILSLKAKYNSACPSITRLYLAHNLPCSTTPKAGTFAIKLRSSLTASTHLCLDWKQGAPQLVHLILFFFPSSSTDPTDPTDHFHPQSVRIVGAV
jgi:hypothetical protein